MIFTSYKLWILLWLYTMMCNGNIICLWKFLSQEYLRCCSIVNINIFFFSGGGVFDDVEQRKLGLKKLLSILFLFCTYGNITGSSIWCCLFCTGSSKRTRYNYGQCSLFKLVRNDYEQCSLFKLVRNVYYLCNLYSHSIVIDQCVFILSRFKFVKDGKYKARITFYNLTTRKYWNIETSLWLLSWQTWHQQLLIE
jgi:hypothetical protein